VLGLSVIVHKGCVKTVALNNMLGLSVIVHKRCVKTVALNNMYDVFYEAFALASHSPS
jgi:hypothetical protein